MISLDQIKKSVELFQNAVGFLRLSQGKIAQYDHFVIPADLFVPLRDHICVHLFGVCEPPVVHLVVEAVMEKMAVGDVIAHGNLLLM
jgi:hypothetical protein